MLSLLVSLRLLGIGEITVRARKVTRIDSRNTWRETRRKEMADRVILMVGFDELFLMVYRGRGGGYVFRF